ncbi:MAG: pantoate--beta-alanine ligase [Deltaproteobacteria bacterium]|jgi:pantoate--beta-alanine ligase|nr:pantoate--beta-alanine ligase [Deltaproteobacteria bacterium]
MKTLVTVREIRERSKALKAEGKTIGFVPTMGALHGGHASLARRAARENDAVIASVFVNPAQFGPGEDFETYPRDFEGDAAILESLGVDSVFRPAPGEIYPEGFATKVEVSGLTDRLCGGDRPGHFAGVATVVAKLFNLVRPDRAYFGLKDAQQFFVLKRMAEDLNADVSLVPCPTVREPDGLAMSSRNLRLSPEERKAAPRLHAALELGRKLALSGETDPKAIIESIVEEIRKSPLFEIDHVEMVDTKFLKPVGILKPETAKEARGEVLAAAAVRLGKTRLIDNFIL